MLCGCNSNKSSKTPDVGNDAASVCYYKDDSGVFTGTEDNAELLKKTPSPSQRKIASLKNAAQLKSDQAYPGCFAWNELQRSKDDLDIYGSPQSISSSDKASLYRIKKSPSIPILEMHEPTCSLYSQDRMVGSARMYQPYKGQLNVAVYVNCGLLTVHVKEARQLSNTYGSDCNSYVKLALTPDDTKRTKCKTSIVRNLNSPAFEEKFSFELLEGDMKKRLQISMWHKENNHSPSELLGCMSFGVKHIIQQKTVVDGWYFLLSDAIGRRKHLQVGQHHQKVNTSTTHTSEEDSTDKSTSKVTPDSPHPQHMNSVGTVILHRSMTGFGFQVTGDRPARILKIQEGSPSEVAGLIQGDCILKVNEHDVSNLSSDTVARILRQCADDVKITYQRHQRKPPDILKDTQSADPIYQHTNNVPIYNNQQPLPNQSQNNYELTKPGSPKKERKGIMKPPGSPLKDKRGILKPGGSPVAYQREMEPHLSPEPERRDYEHMTSPVVGRRNNVKEGSPRSGRRNVASPISGRKTPSSPVADRRPHSSPVKERKFNMDPNDRSAYVNVGYGNSQQNTDYQNMSQQNGYLPNSHQPPSGYMLNSHVQPMGSVSNAQPNGYSQPNGHMSNSQPNGHVSNLQPNGYVSTSQPNGHVSNSQPNRHVSNSQPKGHVSNSQPNGYSQPNGHVSNVQPNGHVSNVQPNGYVQSNGYSMTTSQPNGYVPPSQPNRYVSNSQPNGYSLPNSQPQNGYVPNSAPSGYMPNSHQNGHLPNSQPNGYSYSSSQNEQQHSNHQPVLNGRVPNTYSNKLQSTYPGYEQKSNSQYNPSHQNLPMQQEQYSPQKPVATGYGNKAFNSFTPDMILPNKTIPGYHSTTANQNYTNISNGQNHSRQPMINGFTNQQQSPMQQMKYKNSTGESDISSSEDGVHDYYIDEQVIRHAQQLKHNGIHNGQDNYHVNGGYSNNGQPHRHVTSF